MFLSLRYPPFIYRGQEVGMTNAEWNSGIEEMDDVRARDVPGSLEQNGDPQKVLEYFEGNWAVTMRGRRCSNGVAERMPVYGGACRG